MSSDIAIIEIRGAVGGEEAKIWADDLLRMYWRFGEKKGWQTQLLARGVLRLKSREAFSALKHESGVHRVQRIPSTEKHDRIHTSTATVAVLPGIPEAQIKINPNDLEWQFYRASTQGGQNVQKVSSAVRLIHKPTNTTVTCEQERTQAQNRQLALELLRTRLWEKEEQKKETTIANYRSPIGRGMRAEKIRTYNYPQNRIKDHRINKTWHNLKEVLDGELNKIIRTVKNSSAPS